MKQHSEIRFEIDFGIVMLLVLCVAVAITNC